MGLQMHEVTHSPSIDALAAALVKAQSQVKAAAKDSTNPFFKSKYADLSSVWEACRAALTANGLSVTQFPGFEDGSPGVATVTTILLHSSGQWIKGTAGAPLPPKVSREGKESPADAQSVGSAITYLRRYALAAVLGVVQDDDDGESAVNRRPASDTAKATEKKANGVPSWKGKPFTDYPSSELVKLRAWCVKTNESKFAAEIEAIDEVLAGRGGE